MNGTDSNPTRRDLLTGSIKQCEPDIACEGNSIEFGPLFHFSSVAMGCEFQILCSKQARRPLANVVADAFEMIESLEQQLSIFRPSSDLSAINNRAFDAPVAVKSRLFDLLNTASEIHATTGGGFDITATPLTRLWKTHRCQRTLPDDQDIKRALSCVGNEKILFEESSGTIRFSHPELVIDLGAIGKGYAIDRLKEFLQQAGCDDFLVHGGQSSVMGSGLRESRDGAEKHPWNVGISHPLSPGVRLATLVLGHRAIGTSGSGRQSFVVGGKRYGHIIDPRSGWPADELMSVTVLADSAVVADALSTAIFVAGPEQAQSICDRHDVSAILIADPANEPGSDGRLNITTINLSDEFVRFD